MSKTQKLFENLDNRKFIAFTSGLNFGGLGNTADSQTSLSLFSKFLQGNHLNPKWNELSARVSRLIICGDSVRENENTNEVQRGSYRQQKINKV